MNPGVIVLGGFETGLGVVRSLGRQGIRVHVVDHVRQHAAHSRYATHAVGPHPGTDQTGFLQHLQTEARALGGRPIVMIASDDYVLPVARHAETLEPEMRFTIPDRALLERLVDKCALVELAGQHGVPSPISATVRSTDEIEAAVARVPLPAFIKGRTAVEWRRVVGSGKKGVVVDSPDAMRQELQLLVSRGLDVIVQEVIPGDATRHLKVSICIGRAGDVLAAFTLRKIRQQPHGFGFGCAVESVAAPDLLALGIKLFRDIGYRGVGSAEFKWDIRDGLYKLIEINTRYWQQNSLAERIGLNFPLLQYRDECGESNEPGTHYRCGVRWVNFLRDVETFRTMRARGEISFGEWFRSLKGEICWSDFSWDDPVPGLWAWREEVRNRWSAARTGRERQTERRSA